MLGSRAIYHDGWKATTDHVGGQLAVEREHIEGSHVFDEDNWLLFDLAHDFSESHDVSAEQPERLQQLVDKWWSEAERNHVLPLDDSFIARAVAMYRPPYGPHFRTVFKPGGGSISEDVMPPLGAGYVVTARVEVEGTRRRHPLRARQLDQRLRALPARRSARARVQRVRQRASHRRVRARTRRARTSSRTGTNANGGRAPASCASTAVRSAAASSRTTCPFRWQIGSAGLTIGYDRGFPVCDDYAPPFPFTGTLHDVTFEIPMLAPKHGHRDETAARAEVGIALKSE